MSRGEQRRQSPFLHPTRHWLPRHGHLVLGLGEMLFRFAPHVGEMGTEPTQDQLAMSIGEMVANSTSPFPPAT
ncbi:hypothetical protein PIB30_092830, partial [Stylosanthes scabra]|nr:hypothetical protein [Stylosanthes scabra]